MVSAPKLPGGWQTIVEQPISDLHAPGVVLGEVTGHLLCAGRQSTKVHVGETPVEPRPTQAETVALGHQAYAVARFERLLAGDEDVANMRRTRCLLPPHL